MKDRRKANRVIITAVAEVNDLTDNIIEEGYVANISVSGMGVFMRRPLKAQHPVEIKLSFYTLSGIKDAGQLKGRVKRVESISNVYNVGIEFDGLDHTKDRELMDYLTAAEKVLQPRSGAG